MGVKATVSGREFKVYGMVSLWFRSVLCYILGRSTLDSDICIFHDLNLFSG